MDWGVLSKLYFRKLYWGLPIDIAPQRSKQNKLHRLTEQSKFGFLYMHQIKVHEDGELGRAVWPNPNAHYEDPKFSIAVRCVRLEHPKYKF